MDFTKKMLRDEALAGKTIVVTGGGSGLGKSMTKYFFSTCSDKNERGNKTK